MGQPKKYGERGIRTLGDISATLDFESSALDQLSHLSLEPYADGRRIMPLRFINVKPRIKAARGMEDRAPTFYLTSHTGSHVLQCGHVKETCRFDYT